MTVVDVEQRSPAWFAARLGRVTSSRAADMLATIKSGEAAARRNLRVQLALEQITGRSQARDFQSPAMGTGIALEAEACALYEALTGQIVQHVGFLQHDDFMAGASVDGYVGDWEGLVEVKAPLAATHWEYAKSGRVPGDYLKQIQHQLWVSGAQWCDFLSFCPDFPSGLQTKLVRVSRDPAAMASHELAVRLFLDEVTAEVDAIRGAA